MPLSLTSPFGSWWRDIIVFTGYFKLKSILSGLDEACLVCEMVTLSIGAGEGPDLGKFNSAYKLFLK